MAKLNVTVPANEVTVGDVVYRKVDREAQAGDIVKSLEDRTDITKGAFYRVQIDDENDPYVFDDVDEASYGLYEYPHEFEVYTPVTADITFEGATYRKVDRSARVGDTVRVISGAGERYLRGYSVGDVCQVVSGPDRDGDYTLSAPRDGVVPGEAQAHQLEKVSEEEAQEIAKWAAIGRKVGEFKRGDIVKITSSDRYNGAVGEVEDVGSSLIGINEFGGGYRGTRKKDAILIAPVEQRFDKTDTEKAAA